MSCLEQTNKPVNFYKKPFIESWIFIKARLSGSASRILELLSAASTFPDEVVFLPPAKEIAEIIGIGLSTVYNCLKKIEQSCPFLKFQTNSAFVLAYRTDPDNPKNFLDSKNIESFPIQKNHFQEYRKLSQNIENQQPELLLCKDSGSPQTIQTIQTSQTSNLEVEKKINSESELPKKVSETMSIPNSVNKSAKKNIPYAVTQVKYEIPQDLLERLKELNIKPERRVRKAIAAHHISQAFGAAAYVENSYSSITHPTEIFLKHLPRQPVEKLGDRYGEEKLAEMISKNESIEAQRESPDYWKKSKDSLSRIRQVLERKVPSLK